MTRLVDLDDIAGLQRAIDELQRIHDIRNVDPELRADLERVIDKAVTSGRISEDEATRLRSELDEVTPAAMLEANFKELVPNRPALGAYKNLRRELRPDGFGLAWAWRDHPISFLTGVVEEMLGFGLAPKNAIEQGLSLADEHSIDPEGADDAIANAFIGENR